MESILDIASWIFLLSGGFLGITGAIGLFRFPDFFTRLHAASVTDTLCAGLIVLGLLFQADSAMTVFKLLLILLILTYTSPTAAHALAKSALHSGLRPFGVIPPQPAGASAADAAPQPGTQEGDTPSTP